MILVTGMHRSGTSALAGLLYQKGLSMGDRLMAASKHNARGYWEHKDIVMINEWMLRSLGSGWDQTCPIKEGWENQEYVDPVSNIVVNMLEEDLADKDIWALKDPRICRLVPFWNKVASKLKREPLYIVMLRHPDEVSLSLTERNDMQPMQTYLLWLRYMLDVVRDTKHNKRVFIDYNELLNNWHAVESKIEKSLDLNWPGSDIKTDQEIDLFIDSSLKHHSRNSSFLKEDDPKKLQIMAQQTFEILTAKSDSLVKKRYPELSDIRQQLNHLSENDCRSLQDGTDKSNIDAEMLSNIFQKSRKYVEIIFPVKNDIETLTEAIVYTGKNRIEDASRDVLVLYSKHGFFEKINHCITENIDIIKMKGDFDFSIFARKDIHRLFICTLNLGEGVFRELINYGSLSHFRTASGVSMVVTFEEE